MNKKIVIVEDEFIVADDLRIIVEKAGNIVPGIAASVEEAKDLISLHKPDLVLLDINLDGKLTGIDLAHLLREQAIAFIYISAYSTQSILQAANATQPYGFLVKPFREKDVLVALDVARYRFENSLESSLRREQQLIKSLTAITKETSDAKTSLIKIVKALQPHISFDYLAIGKVSMGDMPCEGISFLRLGMKEYQVIGLEEFLNLTNTTVEQLKKLQQATPVDKKAAWYNGEDFHKLCKINPFKNMLAQTMQLKANLSIPIIDLNNERSIFSFYSRREDTYSDNHLALLSRLHNVLSHASDCVALLCREEKNTAYSPIYNFEGIVGNDPALLRVLDQLVQVAPFDTSVLIQGETGTGKEQVANCIHQFSNRSSKPIIKINCAVLSPTLIESELFGHEKGSFTGAIEKRVGKFEQANGGTIFLDEIGEMPLEMQTKLLRVLQEKEIERVGGKGAIKTDVRIIAATNRVLEKEVADGRFRMDLFYRLNVFPLTLPPLRERSNDIPKLAVYFAEFFFKKFKKRFNGISPQMINKLMDYAWPGNIRELENILEQSVLLNDGRSVLELSRSLKHTISTGEKNNSIDNPQTLNDVKQIQIDTEREYIRSILKKAGGRIRGEGGAAQLLNLPPTTLESRMAKLGIKKEGYE